MSNPGALTADFPIRNDWSLAEIEALFDLPFNDLLFLAQQCHRQNFDANEVQVSTLLNIKTGACPEDCSYCSQSVRYDSGLEREKLMEVDEVVAAASQAQIDGASRFCMGAAWRAPRDRDLDVVVKMVEEVAALGMETCVTAGMLTDSQASRLQEAGLDYYNHNLDTSPEFYGEVITTRTYEDRLETLEHARNAGLKVCSGGILGMGEARKDRVGLLAQLANLPQHPQSVPINMLVPVPGTPLGASEPLDPLEFVRTVAVARIMMPKAHVRLSAGRESMSDELQGLCFLAGANSIFYGDKLLTTANASAERDRALFKRLGIRPMQVTEGKVAVVVNG
ncbi:MAG: biotin synthase BioB [Gammaproteobacteria bacterium]|nr:MAG: biotin synthase BioB [Gammaproteobacteria bacterium]